MAFIHFQTSEGTRHWGIDRKDGTAALLAQSPLESTATIGRVVTVAHLLPPVNPSNIFGIGLNYRRHAEETGAPLPEHPVIFMKPTSAVIGPNAPIYLPKSQLKGPEVDFEAELAVVIGKSAKDVSEKEALSFVLGYTAANDISARRWQKHAGGGQWVRGKSFDTFCPMGPCLVTPEEMGNPQQLTVRSILNGTVMQQGNTADMIFSAAELIARLSRDTTLLPWTVILTGTPAGVGFVREPPVYLSAGDEITVDIEGIGLLANSVADACDHIGYIATVSCQDTVC